MKQVIVNLTQHQATEAQLEAGVFDLTGEQHEMLVSGLNFSGMPTSDDVEDRAAMIAELACLADVPGDADGNVIPSAAMIGGAPYLMAPLERALLARGITPLYAFSVRESAEKHLSDGSVEKVNRFNHVGFYVVSRAG